LQLPEPEKIERWAEVNVQEWLPHELHGHIRSKLTKEVYVTTLPTYKNPDGIPCLIWYFGAQVIVAAELWLDTTLIQNPAERKFEKDTT
jgi:hypothetical protein